VAAAGKKCQPILNQIPESIFQPQMDTDEHGFIFTPGRQGAKGRGVTPCAPRNPGSHFYRRKQRLETFFAASFVGFCNPK
jgi:hypothetical protein